MDSTIHISSEYGCVMLAASCTFLLNLWQMRMIGGLRKKHDIKYPQMYSEKHNDFNCYQRAHQNTLEQLPFFLVTLLLAGLRHPLWAGRAGWLWIFARVIYSLGYYTGKPIWREPGAILSIVGASLPLFVMSVSSGLGLLGWY